MPLWRKWQDGYHSIPADLTWRKSQAVITVIVVQSSFDHFALSLSLSLFHFHFDFDFHFNFTTPISPACLHACLHACMLCASLLPLIFPQPCSPTATGKSPPLRRGYYAQVVELQGNYLTCVHFRQPHQHLKASH